jgi:hypothetical protein
MQPKESHFKDYPICKHYIAEFLSDEQKFKKKYFNVYSAFVRACTVELSKQQAVRAIKRISQVFDPDDGPTVLLSDKLATDEGGLFHPGAAGLQFSERWFIYVTNEVADSYEHGRGWMNFEAVVLHECVHWVRFHAGNGDEENGEWNTQNFDRLDSNQEIGDQFELWAYKFKVLKRGPGGKLVQFGPPETLPTTSPR